MNLFIGIGVVFAVLIVGSYKQIDRAATELESKKHTDKERAAWLEQWTLMHNNIY